MANSAYRFTVFGVIALCVTVSCTRRDTLDEVQTREQTRLLAQAHAQIGMPAIGNFSEKRMMKDLYELRDKPFPTHSYVMNDRAGCLVYLGPSVGYGLPYATQFTAPTKLEFIENHGWYTSPQAEPNGLFMPNSADGTWIMLKDPNGSDVKPVFVEPRVVVSPFRLTTAECTSAQLAPQNGGK